MSTERDFIPLHLCVLTVSDTRTAAEDTLYDAVLVKLADDMETAVRAELSARFASAPDAPRNLIRRLANDEAAVAGAVLAASPVLTDEDLLGVVRRHGQDHRHLRGFQLPVTRGVRERVRPIEISRWRVRERPVR